MDVQLVGGKINEKDAILIKEALETVVSLVSCFYIISRCKFLVGLILFHSLVFHNYQLF